jgi:hypothetical protein
MRLIALVVVALVACPHAEAQQWRDLIPSLPGTPRAAEHDAARRMMPSEIALAPSRRPVAALRTLTVRIYATDDYQRQTIDWQARLHRLLGRINAACASWPGVRFEVRDMRPWPGESSNREMATLVDDLARLDPADDVALVIGLVAAVPVIPTSLDYNGMAHVLSKHMVLRSLHELSEYEDLRRNFETLSDSERETLLAARKVHKEQIVFLHEWAHTLGLPHVRRAAAIMNPAYTSSQSGFDAVEARLIDVALGHRLDGSAQWRAESAVELLPIVRDAPDGDWDPGDRRQLIEILEATSHSSARVSSRPAPPVTPPPPARPAGEPLSDADRAVCADALKLARAGKPDQAMRRLGPIEARHAGAPEVRLAACELMWRRPAGAARAALIEVACRDAAASAPRSPQPQLYLADSYVGDGKVDEAVALLMRARELLADSGDASAWQLLATLLERVQLPTLAEAAAQHANAATAQAVRNRARTTRRRAGLSVDGATPGLAPEVEREYLRAVAAARAALGTPGEGAAIDVVEHQFAGVPVAGELLRCEAALARDSLEELRRVCSTLLGTGAAATPDELRQAFSARFQR